MATATTTKQQPSILITHAQRKKTRKRFPENAPRSPKKANVFFSNRRTYLVNSDVEGFENPPNL
jgi:hypothetical protein